MDATLKKKKVILDFDNTLGLPKHEIDDGLTLLYLLGQEDIEILGITTTFGNSSLEEVWTATQNILQFIGKPIPVFRGAQKRGDRGTDAARFLAETVSAYPKEVTIIAIGPLGNLGGAYALDKAFFSNCKEILCMGGMTEPVRLGWRDIGELNLSCDSDAAYTVLHNQYCPVTIMNAHVCLAAKFGYLDMLKVLYMPKYIRRSILFWLVIFGTHFGTFKFYLWDLLPAIYLSYPELFQDRKGFIQSTLVDLEKGKLVFIDDNEGNLNMPSGIKNIKLFKDILFKGWRESINAIDQ